MSDMRVIEPGLFTTVQDLGRHGLQKYGVPVGGAMDTFALRVANLVLGNSEGDAALEITWTGPTIEMTEDAWIAICGENLSPTLDGQAIALWRPAFAKRGSVLQFGRICGVGCRAYLAVSGGFDVPVVLGSRSTYTRARLGGISGRALQRGDVLKMKMPCVTSEGGSANEHGVPDNRPDAVKWFASITIFPPYQQNPVVRVLPGREFKLFSHQSVQLFLTSEFHVTAQSDRMGYRLQGSHLALSQSMEMISEAVTAGTVQVPGDGQPIVLMADRQTTGGYPRIGDVITVDLPVLAQLKPGDNIRFQMVDIDEAQKLVREQEKALRRLKQAVLLQQRV